MRSRDPRGGVLSAFAPLLPSCCLRGGCGYGGGCGRGNLLLPVEGWMATCAGAVLPAVPWFQREGSHAGRVLFCERSGVLKGVPRFASVVALAKWGVAVEVGRAPAHPSPAPPAMVCDQRAVDGGLRPEHGRARDGLGPAVFPCPDPWRRADRVHSRRARSRLAPPRSTTRGSCPFPARPQPPRAALLPPAAPDDRTGRT